MSGSASMRTKKSSPAYCARKVLIAKVTIISPFRSDDARPATWTKKIEQDLKWRDDDDPSKQKRKS